MCVPDVFAFTAKKTDISWFVAGAKLMGMTCRYHRRPELGSSNSMEAVCCLLVTPPRPTADLERQTLPRSMGAQLLSTQGEEASRGRESGEEVAGSSRLPQCVSYTHGVEKPSPRVAAGLL